MSIDIPAGPFRLKFLNAETLMLVCPKCGALNKLDEAQYRGTKSVVCVNERQACKFHETHDFQHLIGPDEESSWLR